MGRRRWASKKPFERKIREIILSVQIEKRYTKREIFTLYCNQIFFGHDAHGVEAAARLYLDKSASDVNLAEAALLAGIIQTPNRQSPFVNPAATEVRRNYVLDRMVEEGYVTQAEADEARTVPIEVKGRPGQIRIDRSALRRGGPAAPRGELRCAATL